MGKDIFDFLSGFDFQLTLVCKDENAVEFVRNDFLRKQKRLLKYASIDQKQFDEKMEKTHFSSGLESLASCNLVIESITENLELKKSLFQELDDLLHPDCVLASNTSSVPLRELITNDKREKNLIGLHFFFPVAFKNLVEVNVLKNTSDDTKNRVKGFLEDIGKFSITLSEKDHFLINKLILYLQAGCCKLYSEGKMSVEDIDQLVKDHLFPIGVFEFMDHVGIDVMLYSVRQYLKTIGEYDFYQPLLRELEHLLLRGKLGVKTKQGFYSYPRQSEKHEASIIDKTIFLNQIVGWYLNPILAVYRQGICSREELEHITREYLSAEISPFVLADEFGKKQ